jgi:hypothetical protein
MGDVQEAELENPFCGGFIIGGVLRAARSQRRKRAGFGFAIGDCAYDLYTQRRRGRRAHQRDSAVSGESVSQKWRAVGLSTRYGVETLK